MQPFAWEDLAVAVQECSRGTIFRTTQKLDESFFDGLEDNKISLVPNWRTPERCRSIYVPLGDKTKSGLRIVNVPENYELLLRFANTLRDRGLNIKYRGETSGVLAYKYLRLLIVRPRRTISDELTTTL